MRVITTIKLELIHSRSVNFIQGKNTFLIDNRTDMNIIKMLVLKEHIIINENIKRNIKGISNVDFNSRLRSRTYFDKRQSFQN